MLEQYQAIIERASRAFSVPIAWIKTVIQTESSGNVRAIEPKTNPISFGLMQLTLPTAKDMGYTGTQEGLFDPEVNIMLGTKYLAMLRQRYGDDIRQVYSAYNAGPTRGDLYKTSTQVAKHVENMLRNLKLVMTDEPFIATMGVVAVGLTTFAIWYWTRDK